MADYIAVASSDEIAEGTMLSFVVDDQEVAVARCDGVLFAVDNICSHEHAYLVEGELDTDDCAVECPLHGARFDLATGRVLALPATEPIRTFAVREVDGQIELAVEA